jgi:U3 small nucleolar RNA-associated protein 4
VSIAWGPPRIVNDEWVDTYLVTGNSDSSFRKWELPDLSEEGGGGGAGTGRLGRVLLAGRSVVERVLKNGRGPSGKKAVGNQKGTIVWGVGVLPSVLKAWWD